MKQLCRLISVLTLLTTILTVTAPAIAQGPNIDLEAARVMGSAISVMGGALAVQQIADMTVTANFVDCRSTTARPLTLFVKGLDRVRWEASAAEGTVVSLAHNGKGRTKTDTGTRPLNNGSPVSHSIEHFPLLHIVRLLASSDVEIRMGPEERVDGQPAYRLLVTRMFDFDEATNEILSQTTRSELFIAKDTYLPIKVRYFIQFGDWRVEAPADYVFSDFRTVGATSFPHSIKRTIRDQAIGEVKIQTIVFNSNLPDSLFE